METIPLTGHILAAPATPPDAVIAVALSHLGDAGFSFSEVSACPEPGCGLCVRHAHRTAA